MNANILKQNGLAMIALSEGKQVERAPYGSNVWYLLFNTPEWNFDEFNYRPKPAPVSRLWSKPEDVPGPVCWLRYVGDNTNHWLVIGIGKPDGIQASITADISWEDVGEYEYSIDRKVWSTCTVTE